MVVPFCTIISSLTKIAAHQFHLPALWAVIPASTGMCLWDFSQATSWNKNQTRESSKTRFTVPPVCFNSWDLKLFPRDCPRLAFHRLSLISSGSSNIPPLPGMEDRAWNFHSILVIPITAPVHHPLLLRCTFLICSFARKTFPRIPRRKPYPKKSGKQQQGSQKQRAASPQR